MSIRGAEPKLQKMVEDEAEDHEAVAKLLELKETIAADLEKYDKLRKGDFQGSQQVVVKTMYHLIWEGINNSSLATPPKKSTNGAPTSLIDFDGELGGSATSNSLKDNSSTGNLLDDLAGLSFQNNPVPFGQGGSITLGQDTSISPSSSVLMLGMFSSSPSNTPGRVASPAFHQSSPPKSSTTPDYSAFSALQQSLSTSRTPSQPVRPYTPPTYNPPQRGHTPNASSDDEFGTFSSAVPDLPVVLCDSANISVVLQANRSPLQIISLTARFTNKQPLPIEEVTFQMAVPRVPYLCMPRANE